MTDDLRLKVLDGWKHSAVFTGADMVNWVMDQQPTGDVLPRAHAAEVSWTILFTNLFTNSYYQSQSRISKRVVLKIRPI